MASSRPGLLPGERKETLKAIASETAIALENLRLYQELQEHIRDLERVNRELRSLDEMKSNFISAVTHELKQPLALISGYAQTIHDYYDSLTFEEEMHCLRVILERTNFLTGLVEDLLDMSLLEMGRIRLQLEEVSLPALTAKVLAGHRDVAGGRKMVMDFPPDFPAVMADARRMEQVLSNLVSNAIKFSEADGEIRVSGKAIPRGVQVRVEDKGVGIEPSQLEKIFDRFYQADASARRPYAGVGLGLFICRELVSAHGGRIWAENRPEKGAAFIFEIPGRKGEGGGDGAGR
jgi:signal transduction histidine kinase